MAEEIIKIGSNVPATTIQMSNAGKAPMIGVANNPTFNINFPPELLPQLMAMFRLQVPDQHVSHAIEWASLRTDTFCLFVLENEEYNCGSFCIPKGRALEKYTSREHKLMYRTLGPAAQAEIMKMPCIFARRNPSFRWADDTFPAVLGRVTSITSQRDNIRFCFDHFGAIHQKKINDNISAFNLVYSALRNELDEEHWSIRSGNLQDVVARLGVVIE